MGLYKYVTNRTLKDKAGEEKGRIKVLVPNDSDTAQVDYVCPECGFSGHKEQEWMRPFVIKCSKCGATIKIPKLKDEIKKDKLRARKQAGG
jgi:DNA-directed RNA polymerase subunit RPC12/RpoP